MVTAERRLLLGSEQLSEFPAGFSELSLVKQLRISRAWMAQGERLDQAVASGLEQRAKNEADDALWVDATRVHVLVSNQRELQARIRLSQQDLPFVLPGELSDLQVDLLASGDRALHVPHVEWLKKLAELAFDTLPLDCRHQGFGFCLFGGASGEKNSETHQASRQKQTSHRWWSWCRSILQCPAWWASGRSAQEWQ